jgi:hypothetical protein
VCSSDLKQARSAPEEPVYHLRQFGDVTKEQLDRYMATGDINPQPAPVQPVALDVTIDDDDALAYLRDMVVQSDGDLTPIRLIVGDGHSGRGLYVFSADYPDEGGVKIADVATPPAAQRQWVGLTDDERGKVYADWRWSDGGTSNLALCEAIEAKLKEKNT